MATTTAPPRRSVAWLSALVPPVLLAALIALFVFWDPLSSFRTVPPVESLTIERTTLTAGSIELKVRNDGPDPVSIAQVLVNDAYRQHTIGDRTLGRLEATEVRIDYPWDEGLPLEVAFVTSTGLTISHEIEAAAETPEAGASALWIYGLLGLYIGVIPVAVGLLWFPALARASKTWLAFFLAFTVGLLAFLLIDTTAEGLEIAGETGALLDGVALFAIGALVAVVTLSALGRGLSDRGRLAGLHLSYLVAAGIGLHNLGEGLAVGAALAVGEIALGTFLVIGFALHNTTEGVAIVAPLARESEKPSLWHLVALGAIAGVPTIAGAWMGGFAFAPSWGSIAFGLAAGAIAQVVWTITRGLPAQGGLASRPGALGFVAGLVLMYGTALFTA